MRDMWLKDKNGHTGDGITLLLSDLNLTLRYLKAKSGIMRVALHHHKVYYNLDSSINLSNAARELS